MMAFFKRARNAPNEPRESAANNRDHKWLNRLATTRYKPDKRDKTGPKGMGRSELLADGMGHESAHKWLILRESDKNPINPSQRETTKGLQRGQTGHRLPQTQKGTQCRSLFTNGWK